MEEGDRLSLIFFCLLPSDFCLPQAIAHSRCPPYALATPREPHFNRFSSPEFQIAMAQALVVSKL